MKKNPQTFIDIEYVSIEPLIYIFDWNNKEHIEHYVHERKKNLINKTIRRKQVVASDSNLTCID